MWNFRNRAVSLLVLTLALNACTNKNTQAPQAQAQTSSTSNSSQPQPVQTKSSSQATHPPLEQVFWKVCGVNVFHDNTLEQYHETGISGYWTKGCVDNKKGKPLVVWGPTLEAKMVKQYMGFSGSSDSSGGGYYQLYINSRGCMPYFNRPQPQRYYQAASGFVGSPSTTVERRPISDEELKALSPFLSADDECQALGQAKS